MANIERIKLSDGNSIPWLGFGTGTAWYKMTGPDGVNRPLVQAIKQALEVGFRHIDSAEIYGNEKSTGVALAESGIPRNEIFLTTKVLDGVNDIKGTLTRQLEELKTDYVDLYLIHSPLFAEKSGGVSLSEAWSQMEHVKDAGLAKSIGVSNYRAKDLDFVKGAKYQPVVNQVEFHPYVAHSSVTKELVSAMKEHGIKLETYGGTTPLVRFPGGPVDATLHSLSDVTPSQALLAYAKNPPILDGKPQIVVTTSSHEWRLKEALLTPSLSKEQLAQIDAAGQKGGNKRHFMLHMDKPSTARV